MVDKIYLVNNEKQIGMNSRTINSTTQQSAAPYFYHREQAWLYVYICYSISLSLPGFANQPLRWLTWNLLALFFDEM